MHPHTHILCVSVTRCSMSRASVPSKRDERQRCPTSRFDGTHHVADRVAIDIDIDDGDGDTGTGVGVSSRPRRRAPDAMARARPDRDFAREVLDDRRRGALPVGGVGWVSGRYHSATVPSSRRHRGVRQACPARAAWRTTSSLMVIPNPGPAGIATLPS